MYSIRLQCSGRCVFVHVCVWGWWSCFSCLKEVDRRKWTDGLLILVRLEIGYSLWRLVVLLCYVRFNLNNRIYQVYQGWIIEQAYWVQAQRPKGIRQAKWKRCKAVTKRHKTLKREEKWPLKDTKSQQRRTKWSQTQLIWRVVGSFTSLTRGPLSHNVFMTRQYRTLGQAYNSKQISV